MEGKEKQLRKKKKKEKKSNCVDNSPFALLDLLFTLLCLLCPRKVMAVDSIIWAFLTSIFQLGSVS